MTGGKAIERRGNKQGAHQAADLVENRHRKTSGVLNILGERQIDASSPGLVDAFHQLISIKYCSGCDPAKIGRPEKSLTPIGRLKCHEHDAKGAVQRNFPGEGLDDLRSLRAEAPVHHDGFAALQHGKSAIFARRRRQALDVRVHDLQQPSKWVERRGQRKKPRAQPIFAIFEPLEDPIFDERAGNAGDGRDWQSDALAYLRH